MSEGPGGPQGATAGGTLAMRMLSQQAMVASQMKRAANDKAIAQMLAAKKSGPPAARLGDEIQHKSFLGALAGAVLGAIVTIAEGCLIMAACATGPYALVLVPALMYASYKASDYVEEKQNQLESWINSFCDTDGAINTGSENVNINGKPAARAAVTLPPPPPPGAIPEIPQGEPSWGDIATDLLESAAEKAVPLAKAWGNAVITLTESNAGFMDRVSAGASLLFPAGPVLMEFATMVGGRGEIKKDVDFPEAGEDTALCDKENKPPRIAQGSSNVFINNQPAARKGDKLECSAAIVEGSPDVFIGGEQVTYLDIQPEFPPWQRMILGGITIASYLLPPAGLLGKLGNLAKLGKLGNLLGKSGKLLGAKLGALLGKTGKSLKSIANKVIRWVTDPVDPVTGAYCDERTDFTLGQTLPLSFTRFHSSVLPLHGLTGVGWSDSWSEYAWVREQGNRVDIISLGATLNFAFDGESDTAVTLVLQWTRYGDAFTQPEQRALLFKRAAAAQQAGLKLIVGLNADPEFFMHQKQSSAALESYLNRLLAADLQQARLWSAAPGVTPAGWYISAEIDDLNWRSEAARQPLLTWLNNEQRLISDVSAKPVYISSFFAGNMSPDGYRQLLEHVKATGVNVWVQDGSGVDKLTAEQRERYLQASADCQSSAPASGIVYELFVAGKGKTFTAKPKPDAEIASLLAKRSSCGKDTLYFSLRYLPVAHGILEY